MGMLFTGPMGTGKTFVAEAFAKECGLTTIKLQNFRSKWVGATEGNLEKILGVIKAIGQVVVIVDEATPPLATPTAGATAGPACAATAASKEACATTANRGGVCYGLWTN